MGAWRSEVRLKPADLPLLAAVGAVLTAAFIAGRMTSGRRLRPGEPAMPVVPLREILADAFERRYGVAAFNIVNNLTMRAVLTRRPAPSHR